MAAQKIEVGQKWKTRNGHTVRVVHFEDGSDYPFTCSRDGAAGQYCVDHYGCDLSQNAPAPRDLVELIENVTPDQSGSVRVGQKWRTRCGDIVRVKKNDHPDLSDDFPFQYLSANGAIISIRATGLHRLHGQSDWDLTELLDVVCAEPESAPPQDQPLKKPDLAVGQKWMNRLGQVVKIMNFEPNTSHQYICLADGKNYRGYTVNPLGYQFHSNHPSPLDLVQLVVEPEGVKPGIEVGQVWIARNGREVRIVGKLDYAASKAHPWACEDSNLVSYTVNDAGFEFTIDMPTPHDLIERVAHQPLPAAQPAPEVQVFEFGREPIVPDELAQDPGTEPELITINTPDAEALAIETLTDLGFRFDGQCWVQDAVEGSPSGHPLQAVFMDAIKQAMYGKGERHGGAATPFLDQPWRHYAELHGRGFLTGQAAKKLEEAASTRSGKAFETEVLGALVYIGMAVLFERGEA